MKVNSRIRNHGKRGRTRRRRSRVAVTGPARKLLGLVGFFVICGYSLGAAASEYIADYHKWKLSCNASGYVLKSKYPVARFSEAGADSKQTEQIETIYLGKNCDASHKLFGKGKWCWANAGFSATFNDHEFRFPRQELVCPDAQDETLDCSCP